MKLNNHRTVKFRRNQFVSAIRYPMNIPPIARSGFDEIIRHIIVQIAQYRLNGIKTPKALRLIFIFD